MSRKQFSSKADETPEFILFWDAWRPYARDTDGRGAARDAFLTHIKAGSEPMDIVDGARFFLRSIKDKQFVPLVQTWLNRRAFEDMAEQERSYQRRVSERLTEQAANTSVVVNLPASHFMNKYRSAS
ncbi:hypothetical protein [Agrobacterium tumefaciens]|uniref:hypothetical protein n=1 Tax=Agrobacterium tumefaciens TaxID=358 RepID=UPI001659F739|nr:hypothetical protein [Agrobacterium tumefaciens]QNP81000.1 hypothetical protein IAI05_07120 [Agrobacterium tumefaciens]